MGNNTRKSTKEALKKRSDYFNNYYCDFTTLFHNSVEIEDLPKDLPKRYLLKVLFTKGGIAYDKETELFLPFVEKGIDVYGLPLSYTLVGFNGFVVERKPEEVVILRANDLKFPLELYVIQQINKIVDIDMAIEQNLEAVKTFTIAEVNDESALLSLTNEAFAKRVGATIVYRNKNSMTGTELKVNNTGAQYLVDKLLEARKEIMNETLSKMGINVANVDKRERVQDMEIRASQGYALDSINTLIDTFNHDAKIGGLKIRLKGITSLYTQNELEMEKKRLENENLEKEDLSNGELQG